MDYSNGLSSVSPPKHDSGTGHHNELAATSLNLLQQIMCHTREGIVVMDARGRVLEVNRAFCRLSELEADKITGRHITHINRDLYRRRYYRGIWQRLQRQDQWQGEMQHYNRNGALVTQWLMLNLVKDCQGQVSHIIGILDDISQLKDSEEQLSYLAHHDALTGSANRIFLLSWFNKVTASLARNEQLALLFIDLDRFKPINDSFGHGVGDKVLKVLARRLKELADANELVARIGGDEFVMIHRGLLTAASLQAKGQQLLAALNQPVKIDNYVLNVGASIGVSLYPDHGRDIESLLRYADIAMYQAKGYSGQKLCVFNHSQLSQLARQKSLIQDCPQALEQDAFFLQYQPVYSTDGASLLSLEVLLRWRHPQCGVLYPDQILPAVKAAGLLYRLAEWVFIRAAHQIRQWQQQVQWQGRVSINLGGLELEQLKAEQLVALLHEQGVSPAHFSLELCSDYMMRRGESLQQTVSSLRAAGMHIYLNQAGLGRFDFTRFSQLPLDGIKLDPALLSTPSGPHQVAWAESIIRALLLLSRAQGLTVIACGVETDSQWQQVRAYGCDGLQGRRFAPPMSADELDAAWWRRQGEGASPYA